MFAKSIINAGRFLRMPPTSRLLYYDLGMAADDDGVVEAYSVMAQTKATEDDLRVLVAKGYVRILNDDLVSLICDWKTNNLIKSDRYRKSIYAELVGGLQDGAQAETERNQVGTQMEPKRNPNGTQMEPQDRLGKDRLGKVSLGEEYTAAQPPAFPPVPYQKIADMYNTICKSYPKITSLSEARKKAISARLKTYSIDDVRTVFEKAEASEFLKGKNNRNWQATFDWLMKDANFAKVLDGNYDSHQAPAPADDVKMTGIETDDWYKMAENFDPGMITAKV